MVCSGCCPPKVEIFIWQVLRGRVMVGQVLRNFEIVLDPSLDYGLCHEGSETIDHLFLHCSWSRNLWTSCMDWWGVTSCTNNSVKDWFQGWSGLCPKNRYRRAWDTLFSAIAWYIWESRNLLLFKGVLLLLSFFCYRPCLSSLLSGVFFVLLAS
ncbi:hypothetical protein Dsin_027449 [Dipteronia sinensis]|uniref:Reverse transcriptase zinc-binding domain-containing protein n=1 Tax=Dipteronia sinensis TaxID=43782 RepID=A0AAD9ZNJ7_9ROSI|nr:hypothetical protein Dsin_027449 [Dipteronia sinensis]